MPRVEEDDFIVKTTSANSCMTVEIEEKAPPDGAAPADMETRCQKLFDFWARLHEHFLTLHAQDRLGASLLLYAIPDDIFQSVQ